MTIAHYDLFIIGGGINGCGIAADASGRGLSVYLCEQDDLASHTSSASSKMIHGGLRYLEHYEFRLVRESLAERDVLMDLAPHLVQPLKLIIPHESSQRPRWILRAGLCLYDHLGWRFDRSSRIPQSTALQLKELTDNPIQPSISHGFAYYDCKVDDARLVIANALSAKEKGACIETHTKFIDAEQKEGYWHCQIKNAEGIKTIKARALINAAGPWVDRVISESLPIQTEHHIELVKGSHIVVPKLYNGEEAYLLQNTDKRVIFVIPYYDQFTMIGTTDILYQGDPAAVKIDEQEITYLCDVVNRYFKKSISADQICSDWAGVRPLQADEAKNPSAVTRDYFLEVKDNQGQTPALSIFGGKITTYRKLAEHALEKLKPYFPKMGPAWTEHSCLPGGDLPNRSVTAFIARLIQRYPNFPLSLLKRWAMAYGSRTEKMLNGANKVEELGTCYGADLYECEVNYLLKEEWAQSVQDILWRRSKLGLIFSEAEKEALSNKVI